MKYAIWGMGKCYSTNKNYIPEADIAFFVDNNVDGQTVDCEGKKVYCLKDAPLEKCDYILIMIYQYEDKIGILQELGICIEKIKTYQDISKLFDHNIMVKDEGKEVALNKWMVNHNGKKVFVCSHEFSRTGVPVALLNTCTLLEEMGFSVLFASMKDGDLVEDIEAQGICYVNNFELFYLNNEVVSAICDFDMVLLGSLVNYKFAKVLKKWNMRTVWWIHESEQKFYEECPVVLWDNLLIYGGGKRVTAIFERYHPDIPIKLLNYFLPDNIKEKEKKDTLVFCVIGSLDKRKGQDVFIEAINKMPSNVRECAKFWVIGSSILNDGVEEVVESSPYINYISGVSQKELLDIYTTIDVLVCPSRDDPMPIVVTQAFQNSIPCIISDEVGQKEYICKCDAGNIFRSEDSDELSKVMQHYICNPQIIEKKGMCAREVFERYFSKNNVKNAIEESCEHFEKKRGC